LKKIQYLEKELNLKMTCFRKWKDWEGIWIGLESDPENLIRFKPRKEEFYCEICSSWFKIGSTITDIETQAKTTRHISKQKDDENSCLSDSVPHNIVVKI
jgi:hypothetical protein